MLENPYVKSFLILLVFFLSAKLITFISAKFFLNWSKKTENQIDDLILLKVKPPVVYLLVLIGARFAISILGLEGWFLNLISSVIIVLTVYVAAVATDIIVEAWTDRLDKKNKSNLVQTLLPIFNSIVNVLFFLGGVIWILGEWDVNIGPFLTSLGVAGVIVGFAMQDSLKNIFGGISLIIDGTFKVDEKIQLETGEVGIIQDISVRSTKIKTFSNELITIPNGKLAEMRITNYAQPTSHVRITIHFGVAHGTDIKKVRKVVEKLLESTIDIVKDDVSNLVVLGLGDYAINCEMRFWVEDYSTAFYKKAEVVEALYNSLNKAKIELPFPTRSIYIKK